MKLTAVECMVEQLTAIGQLEIPKGSNAVTLIIEQAKALEKQQIGKAFFEGRLKEIGSGVLFDMQPLIETFDNYYNETFKNK